jgi:hypothetical protein
MKTNVGTPDRIARVLLGIALLSMLVLVQGPWKWAGLAGIVPLLTAAFGYCPLYSLFGLSTCPASPRPS